MFGKTFAIWKLGLILPLLLANLAAAEERLALVVGNTGYQSVARLDNAAPDATLIAETLEGLGFKVTLITDATLAELGRGIAAFGRALREAGSDATGLFYYAGHGVQSFGTNYLLPVDTALTDPADLDFVAVEAQSVLRQMASAANRTNIVILDACRNNPFNDIPEFNDNGLAEMKAPRGTFLAYATAPGEVALDGAGAHSPFTEALAREITAPGTPIEEVFRNVRVDVVEKSAGLQTPWDTSSLTTEFQFNPAETPNPEAVAAERLWMGVRGSGDPVQVMMYLRAYPHSPYSEEARELMQTLLDDETAGARSQQATPRTASPEEEEMIAAAQSSGAVADYQAYLEAFPDGVYAELAGREIAAATKSGQVATDPDITPEMAALPPEQEASTPDAPEAETLEVRFSEPLDMEHPVLGGRSIEELIRGSPAYPPIEGLPEELWKDHTCSNCHQWTADALCTQAETYVANLARALNKDHPYGGPFKSVLRSWAIGGCQ